jgi:hypothetical protein
MTERRARDPYDDRSTPPRPRPRGGAYEPPVEDEPGYGVADYDAPEYDDQGYGYPDHPTDDDIEADDRRRRISPGVFFLVVAVIGSIAFMAYTLTVREATQIPLLAAGATVLAIVFASSAAYCLRSILRAGLERGNGGRTMLTAFVGGFAAIAAAFFAASAIIGFMASRPA